MRYENFANSVLQEIVEIIRVSGVARYIKQQPPGTVVEDRLATLEEEAALIAEETAAQEEVDWAAMKTAIVAWSGSLTVDKVRPVIQKLIDRIERR